MEAAAPAAPPPTTASLRAAAQASSNAALVVPGFGSAESFALLQRQAIMLSQTTIVPAAYRDVIVKYDKYGNEKSRTENPNAVSNCVVAMNMAIRLNSDPVMVCQNLNVIEGKPSWSAQWIKAEVNNSGKFSGLLKYDLVEVGMRDVEYTEVEWINNQRTEFIKKIKVFDMSCRAWAIEKATGERIEGPKVTIEMAVKEGWYTKNGSKWPNMPEVMIKNRAASFFGKEHIGDRLMGLPSTEEALDIIDIVPQSDGSHAADLNELRRAAADMRQNATPAAKPTAATAKQDVQDVEATEVVRPSVAEDGLSDPKEAEAQQQQAQAQSGDMFRSKDFEHALSLAEKGELDEALDFANSLSAEEKAEIHVAVKAIREQADADPVGATQAAPAKASPETKEKPAGRQRPQRDMKFE